MRKIVANIGDLDLIVDENGDTYVADFNGGSITWLNASMGWADEIIAEIIDYGCPIETTDKEMLVDIIAQDWIYNKDDLKLRDLVKCLELTSIGIDELNERLEDMGDERVGE